jgi:membrane dipeptidase
VDLSHCGRQTAADAIRHSNKPVAFTHTGSAALADHPRNRTDAELRAVADKGGVSGIYFMPFLSEGRQPNHVRFVRQRRAAGISAPAETEEGYLFAADLNLLRRLETLADRLIANGHGGARVEKILGKNLQRVFSESWKY